MHRGGMSPAMQAAMERKRGAPDQRQQQIKRYFSTVMKHFYLLDL